MRALLQQDLDWAAFAREAVGHGLANVAAHALARVAEDLVPHDVLEALQMNVQRTRDKNRIAFQELARSLEALATRGIDALPLNGPILSIKTYNDLGLRISERPNLLVRERDSGSATAILCSLGYERKRQLTPAQLNLMRRLQGRELLSKRTTETEIGLYTSLTPITAALDIDHDGLWRRAEASSLNGRAMLILAAEDSFMVQVIQCDWSLGRTCDLAAFIQAYPGLDWIAVIERARTQSCSRTLMLAASLASICFKVRIPDAISALAQKDRTVAAVVERIVADWTTGKQQRPVSNNNLRLHDGPTRRARYMARSLFLPTPPHVARMPLPARFTRLSSYLLLKIAHDAALLPLVRTYRYLRARADGLRYALASHPLALALLPASAAERATLKRHQAGRTRAQRALDANPNNLAAWRDLGDALFNLRRYQQATTCYDKVLARAPDSPTVWKKRAAALAARGKSSSFDQEPISDPQDANAWTRRAALLSAFEQYTDAAAASDRALAIDPGQLVALRLGIRARMACCDWRQRDDDERQIIEGLRSSQPIATPFNHRAVSDSDADNLLSAQLWAKGIPQPSKPLWNNEIYRHDRIRVAYLSGEYHEHPTTIHIVGVFEHHDKKRFEATAISLGPNSASELRQRVKAACDCFIDVHTMNEAEIASMMKQMEIDIAVDLNGHAGAGRPGIFAQRPAPVQVSFLGNAGTTGAPFLDYIIADRTVIPRDNLPFFTEKIVYLPHCYQSNDNRRGLPTVARSRAEAGLPETGFVYCCFNNNYKITPAIFDVWMRLLDAVSGSVLWLLGDEPYTVRNLRREVAARGISPERVVFAPRVPVEDHLARHALAGLFLDTLPMNAHATASDALWAGLPVLTCLGNSFGGRVAASLLRAVGLPELVTHSLKEYEELALILARDTGRLAAITAKLTRNRDTCPLFDTARFTCDLESAYAAMRRRYQAGLAPANIEL